MHAWQRIRLLRADPPGVVDEQRTAVFVAALEQSEQLMQAAAQVGPAARPLPLFYALSQAGRAIAAAWLPDDWRLAGHGLTAPDPAPDTPLLQRSVRPNPTKRKPGQGRRDSFSGVAEATGSGKLTGGLHLGALWAAIPELMPSQPQPPIEDDAWIRPLRVFRPAVDPRHRTLADMRPLELLIEGLPADADLDAMQRHLKHYPGASRAYIWRTPGMREDSIVARVGPERRHLPVFCISDAPTDPLARERHLNEIAPYHPHIGAHLLLPRVGRKDALCPLMLWWALLFGLSSIARYDPETWVNALQVNDSPLAVPIEAVLDTALHTLPDMIADALTTEPSHVISAGAA